MLQDSFPSEWGADGALSAGSWNLPGIALGLHATLDVGDKQFALFPHRGENPFPWLAGDPAHPGSPKLFLGAAQGHAARASGAGQSGHPMLPMISSVG